LGRRLAHPCGDQALNFQTIQGSVERANGTTPFRGPLDFLPYGRSVSILAKTNGRGDQEVLELAKHDYYHIVIVISFGVNDDLFGP